MKTNVDTGTGMGYGIAMITSETGMTSKATTTNGAGMKSKKTKCHKCGCSDNLTVKRDCGTWGREIATCNECKTNEK